ncbi:MAG: hypothetical protein ACRD0G_13025 [Acidimicrobiales bacterium]
MAGPDDLRKLVQDAIDQGATSVEEVHKKIAAMPLDALKGIEPLSGPVQSIEDLTTSSIGAVYDTIRRVNEQVGQIAQQLLGSGGGTQA